MNFESKGYLGRKCLVTFLSLLMISNINLTCAPEINASNTLPEKSISVESKEKDSWWKRIVSRPENIVKGAFLLGFSTLAALIFSKSINKKVEPAEAKLQKQDESAHKAKEYADIDAEAEHQKQQVAAEAEIQRQAELARKAKEHADAEDEIQRQAELARKAKERADAEAEIQKQAELARKAKERADAEAEIQRQTELARKAKERADAEAEIQRQAELARKAKERADAEDEIQRQAELVRKAKERADAEAEIQRQAELARKQAEEAEVAHLISDETNKAVVVWQPGALEVTRKKAEEEAARIETELKKAETEPTSENKYCEKKSLSAHPVVTGAFSCATNAIYYAAVKPVNYLTSLVGGSTADACKKFDGGELGRKWMGRVRDDVRFCEMLIPSSHDSGTYTMKSSLAATQTLNAYEQLNYGVRCLDFRIRSWGTIGADFIGRWFGINAKPVPCIYHGPSPGEYVSNILNDINRFITENPQETVFIKMETGSSDKCSSHGLNLTLELPEMQAIKDRCLTKQDLSNLGKHTLSELTIGDMKKLRRNIIIISDHESEFFHSSKNLISKFDSKSRSAGTEVMVNKTLEMLDEPVRRGRLNSISPIHTANAMKIFCGEGSPLAQEQYYSAARNQMLKESRVFIEKANMVSLDDIERNAEFIHWLISLNRNRGLM